MYKRGDGNKFLFVTAGTAEDAAWAPSADVYRLSTGWMVKFDLAGIRLQDVSVSVRGSSVTVSGVRKDLALEASCDHHSMEITYSRFERVVYLPTELLQPAVQMEYRDGMLMVRINQQEEAER